MASTTRARIEALRKLAAGETPIAVVLGSGFERKSELVDSIAREFPLAGCNGATIRRVKNPEMLAADCAGLGIPHPELRRDRPADVENWVVKTAGAAGGAHIRRANGEDASEGRYFQRFVSGQNVSALFVGDGRKRPYRRFQPTMGVARSRPAVPLRRCCAPAALRPAG